MSHTYQPLGENEKPNKKRRNLYIGLIVTAIIIAFVVCCCLVLLPSIGLGIILILPKGAQKLSYKQNQKLVYDFNGFVTSEGVESQMSNLKFEASLVLHCILVDKKYKSYIFQMNLFNTTIFNVTEDGSKDYMEYVPGEFGGYIFFNQSETGIINEVIEPVEEEEQILSMKINIIASFQTVVPDSSHIIKFFDTNGIFNAHLQYDLDDDGDGDKLITKTITEDSFLQFTDDDINEVAKEDNFYFKGYAKHLITPDGKIKHITVASTSQYADGNANLQEEGYVQSVGRLYITLREIEEESIIPNVNKKRRRSGSDKLIVPNFALGEHHFLPNILDTPSRRKMYYYSKGNLHEMGQYIMRGIKLGSGVFLEPDKLVRTYTYQIFHYSITTDNELKNALIKARDVIKVIKTHPNLHEKYVLPIYKNNFTDLTLVQHDVLFYITSLVGFVECQEIIFKYGLNNTKSSEVRMLGILASRNIIKPHGNLILYKLLELYFYDPIDDIRNAALLSYAILIKRQPLTRRTGELFLLNLIQNRRRRNGEEMSHQDILVVLYALENAGLKIDAFTYSELIQKKNPYITKFATKLLDESTLRRGIKKVMSEDYFPLNRSKNWEKKLGGKYASAKFYAGYFVGADYFCNEAYFNYKAHAEAYADGTVWSKTKRVLHAYLIYHKKDGVIMGNEIVLKLWGKTLYQKDIPMLDFDCQLKKKNLYHTAHGFSLSYTVVIVVVPVTFQIGVDFVIDISWGYTICDAKLEASAQIMPKGSLIVFGNAHINLLLIKGGVELAVEITAEIIPKAYISGTVCEVGVDIDLVVTPFKLEFYLFYQKRKCKYKFPFKLKCSWGTKHKKVLFDVKQDYYTKKLFHKAWDIRDIIRREKEEAELKKRSLPPSVKKRK